MRKDIHPPKVEGLAMAIVKEVNELGEEEWFAYLLNLKEEPLTEVLVSSKGYGKIDQQEIKTSMLRFRFTEVKPKSYVRIESLLSDVLPLNNEYWVSFFMGNKMYDKKYIFLAGSIQEEHYTDIPLLNTKGILIR